MSEQLDIPSILQNGFFKTSRAKQDQPITPPPLTPPISSQVPRTRRPDLRASDQPPTLPPRKLTPRVRPPAPSCEDELDSLAREYGSMSVASSQDEPPSRGEFEQSPIMLEVFEHNPERRYVIIPNSSSASDAKASKEGREDSGKRHQDSPDEWSSSEVGATSNRKEESENRSRRTRENAEPTKRRERSRHPAPDSGGRQEKAPEKPREVPSSGVPSSGVERSSSRYPRESRTQPEVTKSGSDGRDGKSDRDTTYSREGSSSTAGNQPRRRRDSSASDERRRERRSRRDSPSPPATRRNPSMLDPTIDPRSSTTRLSRESSRYRDDRSSTRNEKRDSGSNYRDDRSSTRNEKRDSGSSYRDDRSSTRGEKRDSGVSYRDDRSSTRNEKRDSGTNYRDDRSSTRNEKRDSGSSYRDSRSVEPPRRKEDTRSGDELGVPTSRRPRRNSNLMPEIPEPTSERMRNHWDRSRSRGPPVPRHTEGLTLNTRGSSSTFPVTKEERNLPYPDDDDVLDPRVPQSAIEPRTHTIPSVSMPEFPPTVSMSEEPSFNGSKVPTPAASTSSWQLPSFDPQRDRQAVETEVGSYRRFSEGWSSEDIPPRLPECPRTTPAVGKMDWLTLPRSNFNCCPDCYLGVFGNTEYRKLFQPVLRPTDRPISCDFGSTPWYRIAWLLTLKNRWPDLQLFHQIDNIAASTRNQGCPGKRKTARNWLTIKDPYKRRLVSNFTVCSQCAQTVEVLLPNLMGLFVPLDPRLEPSTGICALHYTPQRKRFALYFDTFETTADKSLRSKSSPDVSEMASKIERLAMVEECKEDSPVHDTYWHVMQYLPRFTVCGECFSEVVRPRIDDDDDIIARNFYREPQRRQIASCQLYSERMREIFRKACRRNDPKYLEAKIVERQEIEAEIHAKLMKLDRESKYEREDFVQEQVGKLIKEWKQWE